MKISNGFKIAMANRPLCYKMLFSRTIISIISVIVCLLFASIVIKDIVNSEEFLAFFEFGRELLKGFILIDSFENVEVGSQLSAHLHSLSDMLKGMLSEIVWVVVAIVLVIQVAKFFTGICDYVIAVNINEHMSSLRHAEFFTTLVEHFSPACRYALYCVMSLFLYNMLIVGISVVLFVVLIGKIGLFALTAVFLFIVCMDAFRLMLVGMVPAKMVCENTGVLKSFKDSFKGLSFKTMLERFISYFVLRLIVFSTSILFSITTFYVSLLVTIPLYSITYMAVRFIDYYTVHHNKYFITYDNIVIPKEHRTKGEQLLNKVDID